MAFRRRLLGVLAALAGAALLAWQVRATGADAIARGLAAVGAGGAAAILVLSYLRFGARALAWTALLPGDTPPGRAVAATIAGDAAGNLTPLSLAISEPTKAALLGWSAPTTGVETALAALVAETFFFAVSVAAYVMLGAAAFLWIYPLDRTLQTAGLAALAGMTLVVCVAAWMAVRRPTIAGSLLERLPIAAVRRAGARVRAFERTAYGTTTHPGARLGVVASSVVVFHALSFGEMWLTLWLVTGESHLAAALVLDTVGRLTNALFKMIPFQLGVLQVGSEVVATAIGLASGTGVIVSLVRTARVTAWAAVGLVILARHGR